MNIPAETYRPFDVVTLKNDPCYVGFITEVSIEEEEDFYVQYAVHWLVQPSEEMHNAWFDQEDLEKHSNLFIDIAKCMSHPSSGNETYITDLFTFK